MTGLGEDVYIDHKANREAVLDELVAESQFLGLYGDAPNHFADISKMVDVNHIGGVNEMVEEAAKARWAKWREEWEAVEPKTVLPVWEHIGPAAQAATLRCERAALESLGIPLSVLAELKAGTRKAVRVETFKLPSGREGRIPNVGDVLDSATKTSEDAR